MELLFFLFLAFCGVAVVFKVVLELVEFFFGLVCVGVFGVLLLLMCL